jgi:hypothetical protein
MEDLVAKAEKAKRTRRANQAFNESRRSELESPEFQSRIKRCTGCKILKTYANFRFEFIKIDGHESRCKQCCSTKEAEFRKVNLGAQKKNNERCKKHREQNPEYYKENSRNYRLANPEKTKSYKKNWVDINRGKVYADNAARLDYIDAVTPSWADQVAIEAVYIYAQLWSILTKVKQSVDHEIPLRGKEVCGLHVQNNLRIMPLIPNISKNNKFDPDTFIGP